MSDGDMSESETQNTESTKSVEPTETVETDVELAEQPSGSQPTEVPAAEPQAEETSPEAAVGEVDAPADEAPAAPEAEAPAEDAPAAPAPAPAADAPAEGAPAAEAAAQDAPAAPAGEPRKKKLKHVPRSERRKRSKPVREKPATRKPIVRLEKPEHEPGRRQERRGVVVSDAMDKTIVVKVEAVRAHQRYKKVIRRSVKFHAHDEQNQAHIGDRVRIVETRPLSKTKRWRLAEILEVAK
jgi:small subunit ribosomal protein S17